MKTLYIYPNSQYRINSNPYMKDLSISLSHLFRLPQLQRKPMGSQFVDIFMHVFKTEIIYFNWIEDAPIRKLGAVKFVMYFFIVFVLKIRRVKIIYMLHNKKPHDFNRWSNKLSACIFRDIIKRADLLLTHAKDGVEIVRSIKPTAEVHFNHLPVNGIEDTRINALGKKYDILIWGTIKPYKGILEFLNYLGSVSLLDKYTIKIVGEIDDLGYKKQLERFNSSKLAIEDRCVESEELKTLVHEARIVLFNYQDNTVLSSSALMQTLAYGATVLASATGAFKDLGEEQLIFVYNDYGCMISMIDDILCGNKALDEAVVRSFILKNTWPQYARKVHQLIAEISNGKDNMHACQDDKVEKIEKIFGT